MHMRGIHRKNFPESIHEDYSSALRHCLIRFREFFYANTDRSDPLFFLCVLAQTESAPFQGEVEVTASVTTKIQYQHGVSTQHIE